MKNPRVKYRLGKSAGFQGLVILLSVVCVLPLIAILLFIIDAGFKTIRTNGFSFLTNLPKPVGEVGGGIANAFVGSMIIIAVASIIAIPIGILCGIYLSENKNSKIAYWSRLCVDILQGIPSIVIGIVAYFWFVKPMGGFSALSGSLALSIMMLPIVVRSTEAFSSCRFARHFTLWIQRNSFRCHAISSKDSRRDSTASVHSIWQSVFIH
jgi:phosphate transport system permease protein